MKKIFFGVLFIHAIAVSAFAMEITFEWEYDDPASVDGFRLYQRTGDSYGEPIWEGKDLTCTIEVDPDTEYGYVVRAFKTMPLSGEVVESENSNEVFKTPEVEPVKNLIIRALDQIIDGLSTLKGIVEAN